MKKFKVGDKVLVTSGKDKGKKSEITKILHQEDRVVVKGINIYKKHVKPTDNKPGGIMEIERPLPTSKIMVLGEDGKPTRVGFKSTKAGKYRVSKKTGKKI